MSGMGVKRRAGLDCKTLTMTKNLSYVFCRWERWKATDALSPLLPGPLSLNREVEDMRMSLTIGEGNTSRLC